MRQRALEIVPMRSADLDEVMEIAAASFPSPWPRKVFAEELDREWAHIDVLRERAADGASHVVGFCNYWLVHDEVHLLNIAVAPDQRRRGLALRMMDHLVEFCRRHECRYVTLEVRRSNEAAIELYRSCGFEAVGLRPRYYADDNEDAVLMTLDLETAEP